MTAEDVTLAPVDESVLAGLREVALSDATADEVTPPLTPGPRWTDERVAWFEDYHRSCRAGLDGERREVTWAVVHRGAPVGAVRLRATEEEGTLETGIWLARAVRGQGLSVASIRLAVHRAREAGARRVVADTAVTNLAAQALLLSAGFTTAEAEDGRVRAHLDLG